MFKESKWLFPEKYGVKLKYHKNWVEPDPKHVWEDGTPMFGEHIVMTEMRINQKKLIKDTIESGVTMFDRFDTYATPERVA